MLTEKNNIDKLFQSRLGNYESKITFDEDALWTNINKSTTSSATSIFRKPVFYIGIITLATVISAAAAIVISNCKKEVSQKTIQPKPVIIQNNLSPNVNDTTKEPLITSNTVDQTTNVTKSNQIEPLLNKNKTVQPIFTNAPESNQDKTRDLDTAITTNQNNQNSNKEIVEDAKPQKKVTKITVVKKQVIQKDSVVSVKRIR
jgi:hypothetical protein